MNDTISTPAETMSMPPAMEATPETKPLASRTEALTGLVIRARTAASRARVELGAARNIAVGRVQDARVEADAFVAASMDRVRQSLVAAATPVRGALREQLERAACALQAAAKRVDPNSLKQ